MNQVNFQVFFSTLKSIVEPAEYVEYFLNSIEVKTIICTPQNQITITDFKDLFTGDIPFSIDYVVEKDIRFPSLMSYGFDIIERYSELLNQVLRKEEDLAPENKKNSLYQIAVNLKASINKYVSQSRYYFSPNTTLELQILNYPKPVPIPYNKLLFSADAENDLKDIFTVRYEFIQKLLTLTELSINKLDKELSKTYIFKLPKKDGAMLISEFVVALTDEKNGYLNLDKKGKHSLAKTLFNLFGLEYSKWLENDILCRDKPALYLDKLSGILTQKKFPKKPRPKIIKPE